MGLYIFNKNSKTTNKTKIVIKWLYLLKHMHAYIYINSKRGFSSSSLPEGLQEIQ